MEKILHEDDPLAVVLPVLNNVPETSEELHDSGRDIPGNSVLHFL